MIAKNELYDIIYVTKHCYIYYIEVKKVKNENECLGVNGIMKSGGDLSCEKLDVNGVFRVNGNLKSQTIKGNGIIKVAGKISSNDINFDGIMSAEDKIHAETMDINGVLKAVNITGENIKINGKIKVTEQINCDELNLIISGKSSISNIEARKVNVSSSSMIKRYLKVRLLSADEIVLENVVSENISGDKIKIGKGCKVNTVNYITSLDVDNKATVKVKQKIF